MDRLHYADHNTLQIRYMAVVENLRGRGIGCPVLKCLETAARERKAQRFILDARETAVGFYQRQGYLIVGEGNVLFSFPMNGILR